jgi:hypothetical protein
VIEHCRKTDLSRASVGGDQRQREIDGIIVEALLREYLARRLGNYAARGNEGGGR